MDETLAIVLLSFYGLVSTVLFVCSVLFCRMTYTRVNSEEN
jgi:hypothetical protein